MMTEIHSFLARAGALSIADWLTLVSAALMLGHAVGKLNLMSGRTPSLCALSHVALGGSAFAVILSVIGEVFPLGIGAALDRATMMSFLIASSVAVVVPDRRRRRRRRDWGLAESAATLRKGVQS